MKQLTAIVKIVGNFCNLKCEYCFYYVRDQSTPHVMSENLLEKFITEYMDLCDSECTFIWIGGEPLLAGLPFFQKIVNLQSHQSQRTRKNQKVRNIVQTNATLIDERWAEFFKAHNFGVGVSLDGSRKSHDRFRKDKNNKSTFERVIRGIKILRQHGIEPGIIQTLTRDNLKNAVDDFVFFVDVLQIKSWAINEYLDLEEVNKTMLAQQVTSEELSQFLRQYIDLWLIRDDPHLRIREIENFISVVFHKKPPLCSFNGSCPNFFCLEYDGRVYPCDRLSYREEFLLGNLAEQSLVEILHGPARQKYIERATKLPPDCEVCYWKMGCHNGCPYHRIGDIEGKYYYCATRKRIFSYLKEKVEKVFIT